MKKYENLMECARGKIQKEICKDLLENNESTLPQNYEVRLLTNGCNVVKFRYK